MKLYAILKADGDMYPVNVLTDTGAFLLGIPPNMPTPVLMSPFEAPHEIHVVGETIPPASGAFCQHAEIILVDENKNPVVIELTPDPTQRSLKDIREGL